MAERTPIYNLDFTVIGGVGEMIYRTVHFSGYEKIEKNGIEWIVPEFPSPFAPVKAGVDYNLTGQEVLVSLYNLFTSLNNPDSHTDIEAEVLRWCSKNLHPYDIDALYETATELPPGSTASEILQVDARFEMKTFLHDLCSLGTAFSYQMALMYLQKYGKPAEARALYYEGRLCDGLPSFERYRNIENDDEYVKAVLDDFNRHIVGLISLFPDFHMRLKFDKKTGKVMYGADVQSVFDIAWYTFSRMVADVAPPVDEDLNYMDSQGAVLSCLACGKAFVRHSSRQLYCGSVDCEAERNRKNRRACYARSKARSVENRVKSKENNVKPF